MKNSFRWVEEPDKIGERFFTFDGITIFNLFRDYPYKLTPEQKEIFDKKILIGRISLKKKIGKFSHDFNCVLQSAI